ncbi:MAG TPA: DUF6600 domain-containing protein [Verrucomicrobiae bacterium]|jgi:hypothetical protein
MKTIIKEFDLPDRKLKIAIVLAVAAIGWLCLRGAATANAQTNPANLSPGVQEVVKLTQARMGDDVIISYIKNSGVSYHLSADDILYLHGQGVSQGVLSALLNATPSTPPAAPITPLIPSVAVPGGAPPPAALAQPSSAPPVLVPEGPSGPLPGSDINMNYFQAKLSPFGAWVDVAGYGLCWEPSIQTKQVGWRPYFDGGHWEYTDDGWMWNSDYPWGQYVFHYGRWMRDARYGWLWVPGYEWAPSWVCWRNDEADGYSAWAPLPPGARFEAGVGLFWNGHLAVNADFGLGADAFVFVPFDHFWAHDYRPFLAPFDRVPVLFRASFVANGYGFVNGRFVIGGIGRERIGLLTHHEVVLGRIEFHDAHIAHSFELQRAHSVEVIRGHGFEGRDGHDFRDDHRGFDRDHR